jgi:hypothetical protein
MTAEAYELPPVPEDWKFPFHTSFAYRNVTVDEAQEYARAAIQQERERCIAACENERVAADETGAREDFAYNNAIGHCIAAIRAG